MTETCDRAEAVKCLLCQQDLLVEILENAGWHAEDRAANSLSASTDVSGMFVLATWQFGIPQADTILVSLQLSDRDLSDICEVIRTGQDHTGLILPRDEDSALPPEASAPLRDIVLATDTFTVAPAPEENAEDLFSGMVKECIYRAENADTRETLNSLCNTLGLLTEQNLPLHLAALAQSAQTEAVAHYADVFGSGRAGDLSAYVSGEQLQIALCIARSFTAAHPWTDDAR